MRIHFALFIYLLKLSPKPFQRSFLNAADVFGCQDKDKNNSNFSPEKHLWVDFFTATFTAIYIATGSTRFLSIRLVLITFT